LNTTSSSQKQNIVKGEGIRDTSKYWTFIFLPVFIPLLYFALRNAPLAEIWSAVKQLTVWQIASLFAINVAMYLLVTLRWWIIARASNKNIPYFPLVLIRVAVFGISYFTLGPQIGGEPLQIFYLQRKYGMTYTRATSTVIMDKLLEFLANFVLLVIGLTAVFEAGIFSTNASKPLVSLTGVAAMAAILTWPFIHIALMIRGIYPVSAALRLAFPKSKHRKWIRFIIVSEQLAGLFCQRNPRALWSSAAASLAAGAGMITEYFLITSFLGIDLHHWQTVAGWATSWLSFLVPLPGGLGALEASQVFTLSAFGISAALALSVVLLIRARDLLIGGLGLLLASRGVR
jgi:uncharacterized protein (TIRG00374 family)